jgi:disulfide bond formation protein DsbB
MKELERNLNCIFILALCGIILGAFLFQVVYKEAPCPLCLLQRLGMISIICSGLLNLKFGIQTKFYAMALTGSLIGAAVSIRQILLHIVPGFTPFGSPMMGLSLYTWALVTFVVSIIGVSFLLYIYDPKKHQKSNKIKMNTFSKFTFAIALIIVCANLIYTFIHCGLGPCEA